MEAQIKSNRTRIDGLAQLTGSLWQVHHRPKKNPVPGESDYDRIKYLSKELGEAKDSLFFAKAWLGKALGALGTESPYANDGNRHSVADIEPAADTLKNTMDLTGSDWGTNHIEKVDWLRQQIGEICREVLPMNPNGTWRREYLYINHAHTHLCEARFWLGFELERIKKEENGKVGKNKAKAKD